MNRSSPAATSPGSHRKPGDAADSHRTPLTGLARALLLIVATVTASCSGALTNGLYLLPIGPQYYIVEDFVHPDEDFWRFDAEAGYDPGGHEVSGGYFLAGLPRQFLRSRDPVPGRIEVTVTWEIWPPEDVPPPVEENYDSFDFRVLLDQSDSDGLEPSGVWASFKIGEFATDDSVTIANDVDGNTSYASQPTLLPTSGTFVVVFDANADPPTISATLIDRAALVLVQTELEVPGGWSGEPHLMVEASGHDDGIDLEFRAIDRVTASEPEDA